VLFKLFFNFSISFHKSFIFFSNDDESNDIILLSIFSSLFDDKLFIFESYESNLSVIPFIFEYTIIKKN
jgi:hypothetical protein